MIIWGVEGACSYSAKVPGKNVTPVCILRVQGGLWFELVKLEAGDCAALGLAFG